MIRKCRYNKPAYSNASYYKSARLAFEADFDSHLLFLDSILPKFFQIYILCIHVYNIIGLLFAHVCVCVILIVVDLNSERSTAHAVFILVLALSL